VKKVKKEDSLLKAKIWTTVSSLLAPLNLFPSIAHEDTTFSLLFLSDRAGILLPLDKLYTMLFTQLI